MVLHLPVDYTTIGAYVHPQLDYEHEDDYTTIVAYVHPQLDYEHIGAETKSRQQFIVLCRPEKRGGRRLVGWVHSAAGVN